ncbi:MAG: LysR family transcriptional regulator [Treponema sp.]|nr:LysR family transcriptional regulator [Treponema sp.]
MEFRSLKSFVEIAHQKSFSHAAERLGYTQAALTIQIKQLEQDLGVKLFDRIGKQTLLNHSGQTFYNYATKILHDVEEAQSVLSAQETELCGSLVIGTIDSICSTVLPHFVQEFHLIFPKVHISIMVDTPKKLFQKLKDNEIDLIYYLDEIHPESNLIISFSKMEEAVFVMSSMHELLQENPNSEYTIDQILQWPLILTEKGASYRFLLEQKLTLINKKVRPIIETGNTDFILNMINRNLGISFLPRFIVEDYIQKGKMKVVDIKGFSLPVWQQIIYHKDKWLSREMESFIQIVKNHFPR